MDSFHYISRIKTIIFVLKLDFLQNLLSTLTTNYTNLKEIKIFASYPYLRNLKKIKNDRGLDFTITLLREW